MSEAQTSLNHDELMAMPISAVVDGWTINNGKDLYLWIERDDGVIQTTIVPRNSPWQRK